LKLIITNFKFLGFYRVQFRLHYDSGRGVLGFIDLSCVHALA